jgi:drug/metabolite transporter (DMT)-like permease
MKRMIWLGVASAACAAAGLVIIFEIIRPFRDLAKDGPLAMISWSVGAVIGVSCFFGPQRSVALALSALLLNLLPLAVCLALLYLLGHSNFGWH